MPARFFDIPGPLNRTIIQYDPDPPSTCSTCKHFRLQERWNGDYPEDWGFCSRITVDHDPEEPGIKAVVHQQWGTTGELAVAPDFGCVQYEPKEDQP
jgi:hypothetical protein